MGETTPTTIRVAPGGAYAVLGVRPGASRDEVRSAYRRLVRSYHPDTGVGGSAERLGAVIAAYRSVAAATAAAPEPYTSTRVRHVDVYA